MTRYDARRLEILEGRKQCDSLEGIFDISISIMHEQIE
jgi:hypothetical protein